MSKYQIGTKRDWHRVAKKIESGEIIPPASDIPELIEWLQDTNWPGAREVGQYLQTCGQVTPAHIATVLKSGDECWIQRVLSTFSDCFDTDFWLPLKDDLCRLASQYDPEWQHVAAMYLLAHYRLVPTGLIREQIAAIRPHPDADQSDYDEIEKELERQT